MADDDAVVTLDMDALTPAQRDVIGQIAIGMDGGHGPRTLAALERMGLIVGYDERASGVLGPMRIRRYEVPVAVHMQWAQWCASRPDPDEEA